MIGIRPQAGLANRMRSLDSAINLAKDLKKELFIYWVKTPDFNCSFQKLFKMDETFHLIESSSLLRDNGRAQKFQKLILSTTKLNWPQGYQRYIYHDELINLKVKGNIKDFFFGVGPVFIQTETRFYNEQSNYASFVPSEEIEEKISEFSSKFLNIPYIGIHIRRSDNVQSIINSPTELFIKYIEQEISENRNALFYLATDSPEEENHLKSLFQYRIVTRKKELERSNPIGIQDALIDMLLLSRSKKIYGSYYSSFSEAAAAIHQIPFVTVRKSLSLASL